MFWTKGLASVDRDLGELNKLDLYRYGRDIERLVAESETAFLPNSDFDHASLLVQEFFAQAKIFFRILTGNLNTAVYERPNVVAAALDFLSKPDTCLHILFEGDVSAEYIRSHPLISKLPKHKVSVRKLNGNLRSKIPFHFLLIDDSIYRFEANKFDTSAMAGFHDCKLGKKLMDFFKSLEDDRFSETISLQDLS